MHMPTWLRAVVALLIVTYMQAGPIHRQLLGWGKLPYTMTWTMYRGSFPDVCDARFDTVVNGVKTPVDRFAVMGHERWWDAPKSFKRMETKAEVLRVGHALCRALPPDTDLRVSIRCGTRGGWKQKTRNRRLCGPGKPPKGRRASSKSSKPAKKP